MTMTALPAQGSRQRVLLLLGLMLVVVAAACAPREQAGGGDSQAPTAGSHAGSHSDLGTPRADAQVSAPQDVRIALFQFAPATVRARVGIPVTWANSDQIEHSVTHGTPSAPGVAFDSGLFVQGQRFTFTFTAPGEYAYFCTRHPSMEGLVQVAS